MIATADFNAINMASLAAECAIRRVRGEVVPKQIVLPVEIVDASNCELWDRPYEDRACADWNEVVGLKRQ